MFLDNKYRKYYFKIIENAELQNRKRKQGTYYESHHIIPRCMGGSNQVLLTAKEHFICHLLLCKMLTGNNKHKMINALIRLSFSKTKGQERYTARSYSVVRSFIAQKNSENFKGKKKSIETRKRMSKGRQGIIFSETHKEKLTLANQNRNQYGANNGFFGLQHSEETKQKWSKKRKGIIPTFSAKRMKWVTNGEVDKFCHPDNIPEGFYLGRVTNRKEKKYGS